MEQQTVLKQRPSSISMPNEPIRVKELSVPGVHGELAALLYHAGPAAVRSATLIVFFHGGCFIGGDVSEGDVFARKLVAANYGVAVLSTSYSLAPAHPFPAAIEDAYCALSWAKRNRTELGWSGDRLVVAGVDAGGNLATVAAMMARDRNGPVLDGQILIMPMVDADLGSASMRGLPRRAELADLTELCELGYRSYLPHVNHRCHPYASPLGSSRLRHLPPALIVSSFDHPLRDEAVAYGAKLLGCGVATTARCLVADLTVNPCSPHRFASADNVHEEITTFLEKLVQ